MHSECDARALISVAPVEPLLTVSGHVQQLPPPHGVVREPAGRTCCRTATRVAAFGVLAAACLAACVRVQGAAGSSNRVEQREKADVEAVGEALQAAGWPHFRAAVEGRRRAAAGAEAHFFRRSVFGCEGAGLVPIRQPAECRRAARALGLERAAVRKNYGGVLEGCDFTSSPDGPLWIGSDRLDLGKGATKSSHAGHFSLCAARGGSPNGERAAGTAAAGGAGLGGAEGADVATADVSTATTTNTSSVTTTSTSSATTLPTSSTTSVTTLTSSSTTSVTTTTTTSTVTAASTPRHLETHYMYRAQSDDNYPMQNVNTADLAGVLWYLHNEVVTLCPRKYNITRILRLKVTVKLPTIGYVAFDSGQCTVPFCQQLWNQRGFKVGCQVVPYGVAFGTGQTGIPGHWYSLPGPCPSQPRGRKTAACEVAEPGGACKEGVWDDKCTYMVEFSGEVRLDDLTGIRDYAAFCRAGNLEYNLQMDSGVNFKFWDGKFNLDKCRQRYETLLEAFRYKYPNEPSDLGSLC